MQLNGTEDLRVKKTITAIHTAFEKLILAKDYEKITVAELARSAQINKKTFYRYYPTKDDLLTEIQTQLSKQYLKEIAGLTYPADLAKSVRAFFAFSARQGPAYEKITIDTHYSIIRQQMIDTVMATTWSSSPAFNRLSAFKQRALLTYVQNTGLAVYRQWVLDGKKEPLEEVAGVAVTLMQGGVTEFLKAD